MFDPNTLIVAGVPLIALIFGLVEFCKNVFGIAGKPVKVLSAALGLVFGVAYQISLNIPANFAEWFGTIVMGLTFGLAASGFYTFISERTRKPVELPSDK